MVDFSGVPELPAFAVASLDQLEIFIETYAWHRLPRPYIGFVIFYTIFHAALFILTVPIFAKQIKSGRFWVARFVTTPRGEILLPNHLDCSAVLIGIFVLFDICYFIKLLLCYNNGSTQHGLPALFLLRFVILTTIGWMFTLGIFLVRVPPSSFTMPAIVWNFGILAVPVLVHCGSFFLLVGSTTHWNSYWSQYLNLRASIKQDRANGAVLPTTEQLNTARKMLGVDLSKFAYATRNWAFIYYSWTVIFAGTIIVVTLSLIHLHWAQLMPAKDMPMQSGRTRTFNKSNDRTTTIRSTASAGIRKWMRKVPQYEEHIESMSLSAACRAEESIAETEPRSPIKDVPLQELPESNELPTGRRLAVYLLGLKPLVRDAYQDPMREFSERDARAGLRSLVIHTVLQSTAVVIVSLALISAVFLKTRPAFLQPLTISNYPEGTWGVEWVKLICILNLLEAYGTGMPGIVLIGSILARQMKAIELSQARANQGVVTQGGRNTQVRTGADWQLSAPGPSASAVWNAGTGMQPEYPEGDDSEPSSDVKCAVESIKESASAKQGKEETKSYYDAADQLAEPVPSEVKHGRRPSVVAFAETRSTARELSLLTNMPTATTPFADTSPSAEGVRRHPPSALRVKRTRLTAVPDDDSVVG